MNKSNINQMNINNQSDIKDNNEPKQISQSNKNENNKDNLSIKANYTIHGYILLGILLQVIIFVKIKNMYEYEY